MDGACVMLKTQTKTGSDAKCVNCADVVVRTRTVTSDLCEGCELCKCGGDDTDNNARVT